VWLCGAACLPAIWFGASAATGVRRTVTISEGTNLAATVSPDRKTIIVDLQETLWSLPSGGGTARRLTDPMMEPARPDWSPKGDAVAFQSYKGGTFHIWLMKPDGSGVRQLTEGHGDDRDPRFSPDGTRVAFSSDRGLKGNYDIWTVEVASGKLTQMTSDAADEYEPAWSPDASEIAFVSGTGAVGTAIRGVKASGEKRLIVTAPEGSHVNAPSWSPDGTHIAYTSDKSGTANVYVLDLVNGSERRVTHLHDDAALDPVWSPDGGKIAFQHQEATVYVVDLAGGETREAVKTTYEPGRPSWSANGKALSLAVLRAYSKRFREGTSLILTADLATGKFTYTEPAAYKSISTRGDDGPIYSPDGTQMAFVMDGYLWVRPVDANGIPVSEARPINEEMADAPSWSGDGKRLLYLSLGKLRIVSADGKTPPETVTLDLSWQRASVTRKTVIHAGHLWDGTGPTVRSAVDITIAGRRIQKIEPHRDEAHQGADAVVDASNLTAMPGLWEAHNHRYGGLTSYGDRAGRIWLAYGFTDLQSQGDTAYSQMEVKESFAAGSRVGPRYFATGEPIDGERPYYGHDHGVTNEKELQLELERAQALEYDNLKTYVRLPHELQQAVVKFAHEKLGVWAASHYGMPGLGFGMDGMTHVSATSRWGYSYTRSYGGATYQDIRQLFLAAGEFLISTPFTASALYAEDPHIVDDPRIATLNPPWAHRTMVAARDRAANSDQTATLENLKAEEATVASILHGGGTVALGTDSPLPGLAIVNHLGLRAEVKYGGLQPWEALQTATLQAAKAFGYEKDLGTLEPGKLADLILVAGEPLRDIRDAAKVQQVMVDGRLYSIAELMAPFAAK
jgi:Tol biopolymer transport system component/imidazolonepropionase-like amidohydrolase